VATWLISTTGSNLSPAFYLIAIALLALAGGLALPETSRISLHDIPTQEKAASVNAVA
jgi:MHS family proline/betaine transporter-like MFS transporter